MAKFVGTVQEFHHFIGPRLRNAINNLTRKYRNQEIAGIGEEREPLIESIPVSERPDVYIAAFLKRPLQRKPGPRKRKSR